MAQQVQGVVPFGKYDLVASLGRGGMAEIFLARERDQPELLVIKRVLPHLSTEARFLEMLVSEAKVASLLSHPGIVRILGLGQEEGQFYLAMEYVPGWTVLQVARAADGRIPPRLAARICLAVAEALSHAHRQTDLEGRPLDLVHRDVTPGNMMITPQGETKLIDFGIAKAATQLTKTAPGILKGKLRFVSPEQVRQEPVDARSDQFSLGVSLYEITTGAQPFGMAHAAQTLQAILDLDPPRPRTLVKDFPADLEEVILRSLEKHPDDRYPDAQAMADALADTLGSGPKAELGPWLRELAGRAPKLLPPPRDPGPLPRGNPPPRTSTRDKVAKVSVAVRLPQPDEGEPSPPAKVKALTQTKPMSRQEFARQAEQAEAAAAAKPSTPQPRTRTQDRRPAAAAPAADPPAAKMPTPTGRPRTSDRRPVAPDPVASPADPAQRAPPAATALARSRSSDRRPVSPDPLAPSAGLVARRTPTGSQTSSTAGARSRSSDRRPALAAPPVAPEVASPARPRTRSQDASPAAPAASPEPATAPRQGPRIPQWLLGFLLGLLGVLGVGLVAGGVYWLVALR